VDVNVDRLGPEVRESTAQQSPSVRIPLELMSLQFITTTNNKGERGGRERKLKKEEKAREKKNNNSWKTESRRNNYRFAPIHISNISFAEHNTYKWWLPLRSYLCLAHCTRSTEPSAEGHAALVSRADTADTQAFP